MQSELRRRVRAPPARAEPAVSPPTSNGRPRGGARPYVPNHRRQRRTARRARRRRKLAVLLVVLLGLLAVLATVGFSSARSIQADCDLQDLQPATIGSNSFIYAADGSLLGSIPAEKNRQPVTLSEMSPWMGKATVAIEDRRFYKHGGIDFQGIARRGLQRHPRRPHRRGRLDDHAAARPQPLHPPPGANPAPEGRRGVPRDQAQRRAREELDPRQLHEHRLLRQPRLRGRGGGADLLLAPRQQALAPPVGSPCRAASGAVDLRPVQGPGARHQAAERRAEGAVREWPDQLRQLPGRDQGHRSPPAAGEDLQPDP